MSPFGLASSVTVAPLSTVSVQVVAEQTPPVCIVSVPVPFPSLLAVTTTCSMKDTLTVALAAGESVQRVGSALGVQPVQVKRMSPFGLACSAIAAPLSTFSVQVAVEHTAPD